jgi:hypothetical protein
MGIFLGQISISAILWIGTVYLQKENPLYYRINSFFHNISSFFFYDPTIGFGST